ncbi:MAG TPA: hypothetical protein VMI73_29185 [Trebonia sp.]|nr:hypothetical protein [Trebonia sp.]
MALLAVACAGLAVLYYRQSLTAPFTSDGAGNVLQGQAIAAGNPLLRGWWSSDVSFYSTELPEYALVTAIRGLSPDVVHICGALTYTLIVLLTALTARGRSRGAAGYYRAGIAAGMTLALSVTGSIGLYLENPDHAGTVVPVLLLLLLLDRAERRAEDGADDRAGGGWLIPVAACAVLVIADVGDKLTLAAAILPLMIVCAVRLTAGRLTAGRVLSGEPDRAQLRLDRRLLLAAIVSIGLAELANLAIRALGGLVLRPVNGVAFAPLGVPAHARLLWQAIVILFGANQPGVTHQPQLISAHLPVALMAGFHVIGLLLAAAGLAVGLASLRSRHADRATLVLVVSVLAIVAFGVFTTLVQSRSYFHEVAPLLPLSAALAGRVLVPLAARRLPAPLRRYTWLPGVALGAWLALTVAELGYTASWPALTPPQQSVAAWLVIHHERAGLAGYFQATSTTVTSGGQVLVAGITLPAGAAAGQPASDRPAAYRWESSADWYQPARHDATFVIAVAGPAGARAGGLPVPAVRASFGRPVAEYRIGDEVIMLYGYNLLTRLTPTAFPG